MAAVDATDCAIEGTVSWASRDDGRPERTGTPDEVITGSLAGALTGVGAGGVLAALRETGLTFSELFVDLAGTGLATGVAAFAFTGATDATGLDLGATTGLAGSVGFTALLGLAGAEGLALVLVVGLAVGLATGFTAGLALAATGLGATFLTGALAAFAGGVTLPALAGLAATDLPIGLALVLLAFAFTAGLLVGIFCSDGTDTFAFNV